MTGILGRIRRKARVAAWATAYLLVLQLLLSSVIIASLAGDAIAQGVPLCTAAQSVDQDGSAPQKATIRCPLCLARVDLALLPTPPQSPVPTRYAVELRYRVIVRDLVDQGQPYRPQQPRAPPVRA